MDEHQNATREHRRSQDISGRDRRQQQIGRGEKAQQGEGGTDADEPAPALGIEPSYAHLRL